MMTPETTPRSAAAGRMGDQVRSDLHVSIEPRSTGGLEVELNSRVALYYGENIRRQAGEVLGALGVRNARVVINDYGALPFTIAARIEAAARRAGISGGDARPPRQTPL